MKPKFADKYDKLATQIIVLLTAVMLWGWLLGYFAGVPGS